ncbi:MAG: 30S ribosomal protein S12 methylthiotransferase RimO [Clostridia bacterium]|nr:30S ribosomal protein S12 methylthiotransferase RimO [Clostridia bacterium]
MVKTRKDIKIGCITLGCDKNRVDTEKMLFLLSDAGYKLVEDIEQSDVILINTCAFIKAAKEEAIQNILMAGELKKASEKKIVVTGCFSTRYREEIVNDLPEVDVFLNIDEEKDIVDVVDNLFKIKEKYNCLNESRILTTPPHYAYLKIADGCNKKCSYCAIPMIRGKYKSTPIETLKIEAQKLYESGVKELILVAQDTTAYGIDLYNKLAIVDLLKELVKIDFWKIRLLYTYPELVTDELLYFICKNEKMAKYLDIPLQHVNPRILKLMNRPSDFKKTQELINKIRNMDEYIAIRSTFICGFPTEKEEDSEELVKFISNSLDYAGFFIYSREEGTESYNIKEKVLKKDAKIRQTKCEKAQVISTIKHQERLLDKEVEVIYEGIDFKRGKFIGRTEYCAPEIDTKVYFTSKIPLDIGNVYKVKITKIDFNLIGEVVSYE